MGKIYNVQLNSSSILNSTSNNNLIFNIDWANLLPSNTKFRLTFAFMSSLAYGNSYVFPYITTNILGNSFKPVTNGFQNAYYLGHIKPLLSIQNYCHYTAQVNDNVPIYLDSRPMINDLQIKILNNTQSTEFLDPYLSPAGAGTLTQSGYVITVVTATAGLITIGTVLTVATVNRTITGFLTGNGGVGLYTCDLSATVAVATAYTFPADTNQYSIPAYILNLSFEEINE